jgi:AcrR family transcriptional regulator
MPHIDAPTVAEHRAKQREALLDAAEQLLIEGGVEALSFGALGERAGLARNSVYRYFASRDDVIAAVCERELPQWMERLERAMAAAEDIDGRLAAFVRTQLVLVAEGRHRLATILGDAPLGPSVRARINALAYHPAVLLEPELAAAGDPHPELSAQLLQGIVNAGVRLLHYGDDLETVETATIAVLQRAFPRAAPDNR